MLASFGHEVGMAYRLSNDDNLVLFDDVRVHYPHGFEEVGQNAVSDARAIEQTFANTKRNSERIESEAGRVSQYRAEVNSIDLVAPGEVNANTQALVNGQITESLQTTAEKHGNTLKTHSEDIRDMRNEITDVDNAQKATASDLQSTQTDVEEHAGKLKAHGERIGELDAEYKDLNDSLKSKASIDDLDEVFANAEQASARRASQLRSEYGAIDLVAPGQANGTTQSIANIDRIQRVENDANHALAEQREQIQTDYNKKFDDAEDDRDDLRKEVDTKASKDSVDKVRSDAKSALSETTDAWQAKLDDLSDDVGDKADASALDKTEARVEKTEDELKTQSSRLQSYRTAIDAIDLVSPGPANGKTQALANADVTRALQASVERQGDDVTSLGKDVTALQNEVQDVASDQRGTAESLDEARTTVEKQGDTLNTHGSRLSELETEYEDQQDQIDTKASQDRVDEVESNAESAISKTEDRLQASLSEVSDDVKKKADASALEETQAGVEKNADALRAQSGRLTSYEASQGAIDLVAPDQANGKTQSLANARITEALRATVEDQGDTQKSLGEDMRDMENRIKDEESEREGVARDLRETRTTVKKQGDTLSTHGSRLDSLEGDYKDLKGDVESKASNDRVDEVESDAKKAVSKSEDTLRSEYKAADDDLSDDYNDKLDKAEDERDDIRKEVKSKASIDQLDEARSDLNHAIATSQRTLQASYGAIDLVAPDQANGKTQSIANIRRIEEVEANESGARATLKESLQSEFGDSISQIEQKLETKASEDDVKSLYTLKLQGETSDGKKMIGGFGLALEDDRSTAIWNVDDFAVGKRGKKGVYPFIVSDGKVVIDEALINKVTFNTLVSSDGNSVVTDDKIKAQYLGIGGSKNSGELKIDGDGIRGYDKDGNQTWEADNAGNLTIQQANVLDSAQIADRNVLAPYKAYSGNKTFKGTQTNKGNNDAEIEKTLLSFEIDKSDLENIAFMQFICGCEVEVDSQNDSTTIQRGYGKVYLNGDLISEQQIYDEQPGSNESLTITSATGQVGGASVNSSKKAKIEYKVKAKGTRAHDNGWGNSGPLKVTMKNAHMSVQLFEK